MDTSLLESWFNQRRIFCSMVNQRPPRAPGHQAPSTLTGRFGSVAPPRRLMRWRQKPSAPATCVKKIRARGPGYVLRTCSPLVQRRGGGLVRAWRHGAAAPCAAPPHRPPLPPPGVEHLDAHPHTCMRDARDNGGGLSGGAQAPATRDTPIAVARGPVPREQRVFTSAGLSASGVVQGRPASALQQFTLFSSLVTLSRVASRVVVYVISTTSRWGRNS